jgi:hypothetical protein
MGHVPVAPNDERVKPRLPLMSNEAYGNLGTVLGTPQVSNTMKESFELKSWPNTGWAKHVCPLTHVKCCMMFGPITVKVPKSSANCSAKLQANAVTAVVFALAAVRLSSLSAKRPHQHKRYVPPFTVTRKDPQLN